jgi:hypothetical protein
LFYARVLLFRDFTCIIFKLGAYSDSMADLISAAGIYLARPFPLDCTQLPEVPA